MKFKSENWRFIGALYTANWEKDNLVALFGYGIVIFVPVIIAMIYNGGSVSSEKLRAALIVGGLAFALGAAVSVLSTIKEQTAPKRVSLAIFEDHLLILTDKHHDDLGYVRIPYEDIVSYIFSSPYCYINGFLNYLSYGKLKITVSHFRYVTHVDNLEEARGWMQKFAPAQDTSKWVPL